MADTLVQLVLVLVCVVAVPMWLRKPRRAPQTVQGRPVAQRRQRRPVAGHMASPAAELLYMLSQAVGAIVWQLREMRRAIVEGWRSAFPAVVMSPPVEVAADPVAPRLEVAGSTEEKSEVAPQVGISDRQMRALAEFVERKATKKEIPDQLAVDLLGVNNKLGFDTLKDLKTKRLAAIEPAPARVYPVLVKGCETPLPIGDEDKDAA